MKKEDVKYGAYVQILKEELYSEDRRKRKYY